MDDLLWKIFQVLNYVKGLEVGMSNVEQKLLIECCGKRYVAEFREVEDPKPTMSEDMKRIRYL